MTPENYRDALRALAAREDWHGVERLTGRYGRALLWARLRAAFGRFLQGFARPRQR